MTVSLTLTFPSSTSKKTHILKDTDKFLVFFDSTEGAGSKFHSFQFVGTWFKVEFHIKQGFDQSGFSYPGFADAQQIKCKTLLKTFLN